MDRFRRAFAQDKLIWWLLLVAAVIRVAALLNKGVAYDGGFDDATGYLASARVLVETGHLSFYEVADSARVMPGFVGFLAAFSALTTASAPEYVAIKIALLLVSLGSIYVLYLLGERMAGVRVGLLAAVFLTMSMPHVYVGTLTLAENPFTLVLLLMTLMVIRLADHPGWWRFAGLLVLFIVAVYLRQAAAGFLLPALVYLLVRRYPPGLLIKQIAVVCVVFVVAFSPWWLRNERVFGEFVPFTSFGAAPLFEGTYQRFEPYGSGALEAMGALIDGRGLNEVEQNQVLAEAARERIAQRWRTDPAGLLVSYTVMKPAAAWLLPFYWDKVFGISGYWVLRIHAASAVLGLVLLVVFSIRSRARAEFLLLLLNVVVITVGAGYYLGLSRYVYPYMPFLFVANAYFAVAVFDRAKARRR